jgi:hypothetical protein
VRRTLINLGICAALFLFSIFYWMVGTAATQYYLESERDLGNGLRQCNYTEGYVITVLSHQLCPLTIRR